MSIEYNFYFDESFHDRKITLKNDKLNILSDDKLDDYIGLFWGCKQNELNGILSELETFEAKYRSLFGLLPSQELKGVTISAKNFKYGIKTFNRDAFSFYLELFQICDKFHIILQINILSKMEWFVRCAFTGKENYFKNRGFIYDVFVYTMTKMLVFYNHPELLHKLCQMDSQETSNEILQALRETVSEVLKAIEGIQRKEREIVIYEQLQIVLNDPELNFRIDKSIDWIYYPSFEGLYRLLNEKAISPKSVKVVIDREEETYNAAKQFPFAKIKTSDSKSSIQIRLSDLLSNFVGRMIYSIHGDDRMQEDRVTDIATLSNNDLASKRLLSNDWFNIDEDKFNLYRLMAKVVVENQPNYWSVMSWSYADDAAYFFSLLKYLSTYSYSEFKTIDPQLHAEYVNELCCSELEQHYESFR